MASRINYLWVSQIDDLGLLGAILTTHLPCVGPVSTILVYGHAQLCVMVLSCINCPWVSQMNDLCNPNRPLALCVGCKYAALSSQESCWIRGNLYIPHLWTQARACNNRNLVLPCEDAEWLHWSFSWKRARTRTASNTTIGVPTHHGSREGLNPQPHGCKLKSLLLGYHFGDFKLYIVMPTFALWC